MRSSHNIDLAWLKKNILHILGVPSLALSRCTTVSLVGHDVLTAALREWQHFNEEAICKHAICFNNRALISSLTFQRSYDSHLSEILLSTVSIRGACMESLSLVLRRHWESRVWQNVIIAVSKRISVTRHVTVDTHGYNWDCAQLATCSCTSM